MASALYATVPINTKIREIRLIEILPGQYDQPISCKLHRHALGSLDLEFRALSYTWGNPEPTYTIFIHDIPFIVRQNLLPFLIQERSKRSKQLIWIDALCIDQSSTGERNHQVALMKEIYSQASSVIIWLGPASDDSDIAIDRIRRFPGKTAIARQTSRSIWSHTAGTAILRLFDRGYWRRIWIIQEILLARELIVLCGTGTFQWRSLEALSTELDQIDDTRIHQHPLALRIKASDAMKLYSQRTLWKNLPSDQGLELQELLTAHHDAQCTDVRDRVFGLLSLAFFPDYTLSIQADYSLSVREVYTQTLNYCSDRYFYSAHQWLNASQLRKHAIQLQQVFKLDHLDSLVEEELIKILAPREVLDATFEASPPTPKPTMALRNYRWWIPSDGIRREVIQADIQQYLGVDALVKPGISTGDNAGEPGFWISSYRNLTDAMIADLRADSAGFERLGTRGQSYEESIIHLSRQWYGPTYDQTQVVPPAAVARQYTAADPSTWADNQASTSSATTYQAPPPPTHYLASDGNYYPHWQSH